jgi:hypothetical protein
MAVAGVEFCRIPEGRYDRQPVPGIHRTYLYCFKDNNTTPQVCQWDRMGVSDSKAKSLIERDHQLYVNRHSTFNTIEMISSEFCHMHRFGHPAGTFSNRPKKG